MSRNHCAGIAFGTTLVLCGGAFGATLPPELSGFEIEIWYNGGSYWSTDLDPGAFDSIQQDLVNPNLWYIEGGASLGGGVADADYTLTVDVDPFISSSFNVTNNLGVTQNFVVLVTMPAGPPIPGASTIYGSLSGSVSDMNGAGGATIATVPGTGFYEALVDGGVARTLYSDPPGTSISAPLAGTNNIPTANYGPEVGPSLLASIGIRNTFSLTAGDAGQMVSTFLIVPTPGGAALLGLAGLMVSRRRR